MLITILTFIIIALIFAYFKNKVYAKSRNVVLRNPDVKNMIDKEKFQWNKFKKVFHLFNVVEWVKSLKEIGILDLRKLVVYGAIIGAFYGYGYYKALQNRPVTIGLKYGKEVKIKISKNTVLDIKPSGKVVIVDNKGTILKTIKVKDIEGLKRELKPMGFILQPVFVAGEGLSVQGVRSEFGVGISWLKYFKGRLQSFATNKAIYPIAIAYQITPRSGLGLGYGKGYEIGDNRILIYYQWRF